MDKTKYYRLISNAYEAHIDFKQKWQQTFPKYKRKSYEILSKEYDTRLKTLGALFVELDKVLIPFFDGDDSMIDEIIDFIEIDIPAYRVGYMKESLYYELKKRELTLSQKERLLHYTLNLLSSPYFRRELGKLLKLIKKFTNDDFTNQLIELKSNTNNGYIKQRIDWCLEVISYKNQGGLDV